MERLQEVEEELRGVLDDELERVLREDLGELNRSLEEHGAGLRVIG